MTMYLPKRSKTTSFQFEPVTPENSFSLSQEEGKTNNDNNKDKFFSWKRVNKRYHTTTTYLDPEPIDFNSKPVYERYTTATDPEYMSEALFDVEPPEHEGCEEENIETSFQAGEEGEEETTFQNEEQISTPPCITPQVTIQCEQEEIISLTEESLNIISKEVNDQSHIVIARNNTLEEEESSKQAILTPRVCLFDIPAVHKPLKDLINKTYKDFYNTDGNKFYIKAGLSKKTVATLPSLHPTIKRKE